MKFQIGWYIVPKETIYTNFFETAAWYENILIQPGKYPLYAEKFRFNEREHKEENIIDGWIMFSLPGVIQSDNFQSLFFGCPVGQDYDTTKNKGKPGEYHGQTYPYTVAENILYSAIPRYELFPEYQAIEKQFTSTYDDKVYTTHQIIKK